MINTLFFMLNYFNILLIMLFIIFMETLLHAGECSLSKIMAYPKDPVLVLQTEGADERSDIHFSSDGKLMISNKKLWDFSSGKMVKKVCGDVFLNDNILIGFDNYDRIATCNLSTDVRIKTRVLDRSRADGPFSALLNSPDWRYIAGTGLLQYSDDPKINLLRDKDWQELALYDAERRVKLQSILQDSDEITSFVFSTDSKYIAACGKNTTIKVWDIQKARIKLSLPGKGSEVRSIAFSPNGKFITAGFQNGNIKFWDFENGKEIYSLTGHTGPVRSHTFSPDCATLASGGWDNTIRLWDIKNGKQIKLIRNITSSSETPYVCRFSPDGRMLVVKQGYSFIILDLKKDKIAKIFGARGNMYPELAMSSDGKLLAFQQGGSIKLWDMKRLVYIRSLTTKSEFSSIHLIGFNQSGKLFASLSVKSKSASEWIINIWNVDNAKIVYSYEPKSGLNYPARNLFSFSPDGCTLGYLVSTNKKVGAVFLDIMSRKTVVKIPDLSNITSTTIDPRYKWFIKEILEKKEEERIAEDAHRIINPAMIGNPGVPEAYAFSNDGDLCAISYYNAHLWNAKTRVKTRDFKTYNYDSFGRRPYPLVPTSSPIFNHLSFSHDKKYIVGLVGGGDINLWDVKSGQLVRPIEYQAYEAIFSPDSRLLITAYDGVKVYNIQTGEYVTLQSANDEWVTYTNDGSEGYYNMSLEGSSLVSWVFSREPGLELFSFEQFESIFKKPGIIEARLKGDSKIGKPAPPITRPPYIEMPDNLEIKETDKSSYSLNLNTMAIDTVKAVRIFVNGKAVLEVPINAKEKKLTLDVPLSSGANRITAVAYNGKGFSSNPKYVDVICKRADLSKPNLYALGIGVSKYPKLPQEWQLSYAHTDAKAVVDAFCELEGKIIGHVESKLIINAESTLKNITDALHGLESMNENDIAVVFIAGHGIMGKDGTFYFLTPEGSLEEPEKGGLNWKVLGKSLANIKGRVILLLDACHSGNITTETVVPNDELAQKLRSEGRSGIMVFSASKGRQSALESPDLGGGFGAFAYSVTQALGPKAKEADFNSNGFVEFMELVEYVSKSVDKETEGEQTPWLSRKELFGDFSIAKVQ